MAILAFYNIKGGVGKTASTVNLAYLAGQSGLKTLVWDLDPQAASSFYFRVKAKVKGGSKELLAGKYELEQFIKATDYPNLDLLPSDFSFRHLDLHLDNKKKPKQQLKKLIKPLIDEYDMIFLDCPPNISLLSEAVFAAADALVSPLIPTTLSLRTLEQLKVFLHEHELNHLPLILFWSMVDKRKKLHKDIIKQCEQSESTILSTVIPYASDIERMGIERKPLPCFVHNSVSVTAYHELWQEILTHLPIKS
mgnify:CR=1 FL=1